MKHSEKMERVGNQIINKRLYVFFYRIGQWMRTNWSKIITKVNGKIIRQSVVYESRCWKCKNPIRSVRTDNNLIKWAKNKWLGNKKCKKENCNYFICNHCGNCLCDGPYAFKKSIGPYLKKWVKEGSGKNYP